MRRPRSEEHTSELQSQSFPTRRSSDLRGCQATRAQARGRRAEGFFSVPFQVVRLLAAGSRFLRSSQAIQDLRLRLPGDDEGRVRVEKGIVVSQCVDQTWIHALRGGGGRGLPPAGWEDRGVCGAPKEVLYLEAISALSRGVQLCRFRPRFHSFRLPTKLVEHFRPVRPRAFQGRVDFDESIEVVQLVQEAIRLRDRGDRLGDALPSGQEILHDSFPNGGDLRSFRWRGLANRTLRLIRKQVRPAPRTERRGVVERHLGAGKDGQLRSRIFAAANRAGRGVLVHRSAARVAQPGGAILLVDKSLEVLRESGLRGPDELHFTEGAGPRARPDEGSALRAQEQVIGILPWGPPKKPEEGVDLRGLEALDRCEFFARRGAESLVGREALRDPSGPFRTGTGDRTQPLEIALVHRRVGVGGLPKAGYIAAITPSVHFLNMTVRRSASRRWRTGPAGPRTARAGGPRRIAGGGSSRPSGGAPGTPLPRPADG